MVWVEGYAVYMGNLAALDLLSSARLGIYGRPELPSFQKVGHELEAYNEYAQVAGR